ncbi:MAG: GNAT family N-acetyltransferase, partial [Actinomycetota bacterium]|nr:GNAT family N-acetyltransferase [Actinomycetota bacterium]
MERPYPAHWEADVVLRDGRTAHLRPITPEDADALVAFYSRLSAETIYYRFFAPYPKLSDRDVVHFTTVDHHDRVALVATVGDDIIAVARYDRVPPAEAEVAFNIEDAHQGRGVGSVLLEHLAAAARERGIERFVAEVLPTNRKMLSVFRDAGYTVTHEFEDGVVRLQFDLAPTATSLQVMQAREHRAEARSVERLLRPESIVVIGAGRQERSIGSRALRNLVAGGFPGRLAAVNLSATTVAGVPAYPSVVDVPGTVDLAVVAVPAESVQAVVLSCARKGVRGLVVVSSGYAEVGGEGVERQHRLVRTARANGMRVVGPNSFGMIDTDPEVSLNASLAPAMPARGRVGFFSQSGALGIAILEAVAQRGLGLSTFVSAGNRADVSGNDLLQYWEEDAATDVVLLYLESIGNPRKFSRLARRVGRSKPVVAVKSGRSTQGVPLGHSVRESRVPAEAVDAMFDQAGVVHVDTITQLLDVAQLLATQPLPRGPRVAIVANSAALLLLAQDACRSSGLEVAAGGVPLRPDATTEVFRIALRAAFARPDVDSVVAVFVPPLETPDEEVVQVVGEQATASGKTVVGT